MKKKYLKDVESVLALKDTDTKIYAENITGYYQFVNGILCAFDDDGSWTICPTTCDEEDLYILEEEPMQEATEEDVGKLCWFYDTEKMNNRKVVGKLREVLQDDNFPFRSDYGIPSIHCRPLTKEEIKEFMEKAE